MGMAASQARYLALTARKTNTEYEGQQINQARTALANQSANLFNRLLDLEVPVAPKTTDYTEVQYSYTDGDNESVLEEWTQLASPNPNSNYLVKHYYYTNKFTGAMKQLDDPQVQIVGGGINTTNPGIKQAKDDLDTAQALYDTVFANEKAIEEASKTMSNYANSLSLGSAEKETSNKFVIKDSAGTVIATFTSYSEAEDGVKILADNALTALETAGALPENVKNNKNNEVFVNESGEVALRSDLEALHGVLPVGGTFSLPIYDQAGIEIKQGEFTTELARITPELISAKGALDSAKNYYESLNIPTYIGNCELTEFDPTNESQARSINQIMTDMKEHGISDGISKCFDEVTGAYQGGIYTFQMNGQQYFTTYEELMASYDSHTGPNDIDGQIKLSYYNTTYVKTKVEDTTEALLETDSNGRFKTVKFADNSIVYNLNTETVTDEAAYQDAMNEYNYKVQQYEKTIADINAKTSIIQEEDRTLELRLKQLDTEQNALATEMDAVKKVIKDNVEKTFKTFSD